MKAAARQHEASLDPLILPVVLRLHPVVELTEEQYFALCQLNSELWIERNAAGELEIMPPVGGEFGAREVQLIVQLELWARGDGTGTVFGPSTGFRLPDGATRGPDAAWVRNDRLAPLSPDERKRFLPLCPDFAIELRSPSDRLEVQRAKLAEYIANGTRLGWLIDPGQRRVYVYRPDAPVERLDQPEQVSADPVLPGFVLDLRSIW